MSAALQEREILVTPCTGYIPDAVWDALGEKIVEAINVAGSLTLDQVRVLVNQEKMALIIAVELGPTPDDDRYLAGLLCTIEQWTERRVLCVLAAGGKDFHRWAEQMQERLIEFAREKNCTSVRAMCRPGMAKWIRRLGWKRVLETMELRHGNL